jgi:hypothetical protein
MGNEVKDAGFKAGTEGKSASDNPHDNGVGGRGIDIVADVITGGLGGQVEATDRNTSDWESGRQAGEASQKK